MFVSTLILEEHTEENEWIVHEPLKYMTRIGSVSYMLVVPLGFITDLASIPTMLQVLPTFKVNGKSRKPAVLHDFFYSSGGLVRLARISDGHHVSIQFKREEVDKLFHEALLSCGLPGVSARAMYLGVRSGGWKYWDRRKSGLNQEDFIKLIKEVDFYA